MDLPKSLANTSRKLIYCLKMDFWLYQCPYHNQEREKKEHVNVSRIHRHTICILRVQITFWCAWKCVYARKRSRQARSNCTFIFSRVAYSVFTHENMPINFGSLSVLYVSFFFINHLTNTMFADSFGAIFEWEKTVYLSRARERERERECTGKGENNNNNGRDACTSALVCLLTRMAYFIREQNINAKNITI